MKNLYKTIALSVLSLLVVEFVGCSKKDASVKKGRTITKPNQEGSANLFLTKEMNEPVSFGGQILIWNEDVPASDMANIIKLSTAMIQNGVKQLKYIEKNIYPLAAPFRETFAKVKDKKVQRLSISYEQKIRAAATWFLAPDGSGEVVEALKAVMSTEATDASEIPVRVQNGTQHAMQVLVGYCEAKIWERTFKPEFVDEMYRGMRPSPSAMCEGVYQKLGLLDHSTEACSGSEMYKNYFSCLLNEGVRKTSLWRKSYPEGSELAEAFNELSLDTLQWVFGFKRKGRYLMRQKGTISFKDPKTGKEWSISTSSQSDELQLTADQWIDSIDGLSDQVSFIDVKDLNDAQIEVATEQNQRLKSVFRNFNLMKTGYYINENIFNRPLQKDSELRSAIAVDVQSENFQQAVRDLPGVFNEEDPRLVSIDQEIASLVSEIKAIGAELKDRARPLNDKVECPVEGSLYCEARKISKAAVQAIKPENVSLGSWYSNIEFEKDSTGNAVYMTIVPNAVTATGKGIRLCAPLADGAECNNPPGSELSIDVNTGKVEAVIPLSATEKLGLKLEDREKLGHGSVSFSEISEEDLKVSDLKISAVLEELSGVLKTFIGDVKIINSESQETWYVGSIKVVDLNPEPRLFAKKLMSEFCALDPEACK